MIFCLIVGSVLFVIYAVMFLSAGSEMTGELRQCIAAAEIEKINSAKLELALIANKLKQLKEDPVFRREPDPKMKKRGVALKKKLDASIKRANRFKKNGLSLLDLPPIAGYQVMKLFGIDSTTDFVSKLRAKCMQYKEKNDAIRYSYYLTASLIGHVMLAVCLGFVGCGLGLAFGFGKRGFILGIVLAIAVAVIGYIPYDEVDSVVKKRAAAIERDFPRAVSKLALLTISGIDAMKAWNLTAESEASPLYVEMKRVVIDINHSETHADAFNKFIKRCANPFATKLATAYLQNYKKGNSELAKVLRELNSESWSEYRHIARRKGEMISGKLLLPTMLLFLGIIILIIVPVMGGFGI